MNLHFKKNNGSMFDILGNAAKHEMPKKIGACPVCGLPPFVSSDRMRFGCSCLFMPVDKDPAITVKLWNVISEKCGMNAISYPHYDIIIKGLVVKEAVA